jgi:hypothetical protein
MVLSEPVLVVVGIGTLAFTLAAAKIMAAEAARTLEVHLLQVKAITLRNAYHRQILALRAETRAAAAEQSAPAVRPSAADRTQEHTEMAEAA